MALVTQALLEQIRRQITAHHTVVWYDPDRAYASVAHSLTPETMSGAAIHCYDPERGFLWLRRQLEPLWKGMQPPRLLIYVPLAQTETQNALIEFEVGGVAMHPGKQPSEQNTALATVARRALAQICPPATVAQVVGEVEAGKLSLQELDDLAEQHQEMQTGVLLTLFGSGNAAEIAIRFLSDPPLDAEIGAKGALGSLVEVLSNALGVSFGAAEPMALRTQLARQILVTDLIKAVQDRVPQALATFAIAPRAAARQAALDLARAWRNRRDLDASYVHWAGVVQAELGLGSLELGLEPLAHTETFRANEIRLQTEVEIALQKQPTAHLAELARSRVTGFWSAHDPEIKTRWEVILAAGQVLLTAARIRTTLQGKSWPAGTLLSNYAYGDEPWCNLDTAHRHLERDFHRFELDPKGHDALIQLVNHARQQYTLVSNYLTERFIQAYAETKFELDGITLQADIYQGTVAPAAKDGPVAYILVDALRFEMARELLSILDPEWLCDLTPALATPPTVTEIGMAALLPGAEKGLTVIPAGHNKLAASISGRTLRTRQDRMAHLQETVEIKVAVARLDQVAPLSDVHLRQELQSAEIVVLTATEEIDGLCESNPTLARRMLDDILNQLRRGIKSLFAVGIRTVVVTADHGYLFGEKLTVGQGIDAPGGDTAALKRRVWVGQGGADLPGALRKPLSAFGLGGTLEMATPWSLSCFKVKGGSTEYFHGGLSLPAPQSRAG